MLFNLKFLKAFIIKGKNKQSINIIANIISLGSGAKFYFKSFITING